jgi:hypothetical protein
LLFCGVPCVVTLRGAVNKIPKERKAAVRAGAKEHHAEVKPEEVIQQVRTGYTSSNDFNSKLFQAEDAQVEATNERINRLLRYVQGGVKNTSEPIEKNLLTTLVRIDKSCAYCGGIFIFSDLGG